MLGSKLILASPFKRETVNLSALSDDAREAQSNCVHYIGFIFINVRALVRKLFVLY